MARKRIGIIGLGMAIAPHARSLIDLADRVEVAGAFSRTAERRNAFAENFDFPLTDSIHPIDLFVSLAGQPAEVAAFAGTSRLHRMETEDIAAAAMRYHNGAMGTLDATTTAFPGAPERIELICEHGAAILEGGLNLRVAYHDGTEEVFESDETPGGTGADPMSGSYAHHKAVLVDFLDALDQGRDPRITGEEALKGHRLIDAILESAEQRRPVAVIRD